MTRFGYGTNGLADLRLADALGLLADLGYDGVALTLDHMHLDPLAPDLAARTAAVAARLDRLGLAVVVETGARYVLDARRKHHPTLLDDDAGPRLDLLRRAIRVGADLGAEAVSFWSGIRPSTVDPAVARDRLVRACAELVPLAGSAGVRLALEPEPGMLVETLADWTALAGEVGPGLGLTLDIGHCRCLEPEPEAACVRRAGSAAGERAARRHAPRRARAPAVRRRGGGPAGGAGGAAGGRLRRARRRSSCRGTATPAPSWPRAPSPPSAPPKRRSPPGRG